MEWNRVAAGPSGELRCGYQVAARLGAWDIAPSGVWGANEPDGPWSFVAQTDSDRDAYWLAQEGRLVLVLTDQFGRRLRAKVVRFFDGEQLSAWGKGAPEEL